MNTTRPSKKNLSETDRRIEVARNAVAARIAPHSQVSLGDSDVIEVRQDEAHVRLFFREGRSGIYVVVTSRNVTGKYGPVIEIGVDSREFERAVSSALEPVGARLKKG